jgi:oligoendopeptidase F
LRRRGHRGDQRADEHATVTGVYINATTTTDSYHEKAQGLMGEFQMSASRERPLTARLAAWVSSLGVDALATVSTQVAEHHGPLTKLAARAQHQMSEAEEGLYGELANTGSAAWYQLHGTVTSQLTATVPDARWQRTRVGHGRGARPRLPRRPCRFALRRLRRRTVRLAEDRTRVRGSDERRQGRGDHRQPAARLGQPARRLAVLEQRQPADLRCDAGRRRRVTARLPHGGSAARPACTATTARSPGTTCSRPCRSHRREISWDDGIGIVRNAFASYGGSLAGIVDRALDEQWIDAGPRAGKRGGAFCAPFVGDRSLVFLNWSGSVDSAQTTAHELGHAYHNTQLAHRTPMQRALPMALAETASIFCETLVVEEGLQRLQGRDRLSLLDVDLQGSSQVVVDIHSRFLFETEVFARRQRRTLGVTELNELMLQAQADAYGDGLDAVHRASPTCGR